MIKRMAVFLAVCGALTFAAAPVFAFTSISKSTNVATVTFSGDGTMFLQVQLKNLSDNSATTQIWWNTASITPGVTQWVRSDAYMVVYTTMTNALGAVRIYTDNLNAAATPQYTGVGNAAGLVGMYSGDPTASSSTLSMCWRVTDAALIDGTSLQIVQTNHVSSATLSAVATGTSYPCFIWMKDLGGSDPVVLADYTSPGYILVKDQVWGIQHAESNWGTTSSPDYVYFGATFSSASTPRTYRTSRLMVESFTE